MLTGGSVDEATKEYRELLEMSGMGDRALLPLARLLLIKNLHQPPAERDWGPMAKMIDAAEKVLPDSVDVSILRAEMLVAQNRLAEAEVLLQNARRKAPKEVNLCRTQYALAERQLDWKKAEQFLEEFRKLAGDTVDVRLTEASLVLRRGDANLLDRFEKLAENTKRFSKPDRDRLWNTLTSAVLRANDPQRVQQFCQRIANKDPDNVLVRHRLLEQALQAKKLPDIEQVLKEVERVAGQDAYWHYGQAYRNLLVAQGTKSKKAEENAFNDALRHLSEARDSIPSWWAVPSLLGRVYEEQSKTDWALKNYWDAVELGERDPQIIRQTCDCCSTSNGISTPIV